METRNRQANLDWKKTFLIPGRIALMERAREAGLFDRPREEAQFFERFIAKIAGRKNTQAVNVVFLWDETLEEEAPTGGRLHTIFNSRLTFETAIDAIIEDKELAEMSKILRVEGKALYLEIERSLVDVGRKQESQASTEQDLAKRRRLN